MSYHERFPSEQPPPTIPTDEVTARTICSDRFPDSNWNQDGLKNLYDCVHDERDKIVKEKAERRRAELTKEFEDLKREHQGDPHFQEFASGLEEQMRKGTISLPQSVGELLFASDKIGNLTTKMREAALSGSREILFPKADRRSEDVAGVDALLTKKLTAAGFKWSVERTVPYEPDSDFFPNRPKPPEHMFRISW